MIVTRRIRSRYATGETARARTSQRAHPSRAVLLVGLAVQGCCALLASSSPGFAQTLAPASTSVQEFVEARERWPRLVGQPLSIEGRYNALSGSTLRFAGCDLPFELTVPFNKPRGDSHNVQVKGQLVSRDGALVFVVTQVIPRPGDLDLFRSEQALLSSMNVEAWLELGQRVRRRGEFYDDQELQQLGIEILETGITIAEERIPADDAEALHELAGRVQRLGLSERLRLQLVHDGLRVEYQSLMQSGGKLNRLLERVAQLLPGSGRPLVSLLKSLQEDYRAAPRAVYRVADDETRKRIDRLLYAEIAEKILTADAASDGRNGYAIASRLTRDLPEFTELADSYRLRELAHTEARLPHISRNDLLVLTGRYEQRGEADRAQAAKRRWLKSQEAAATRDGPQQLMDLAEEYLNLLGEEAEAARLVRAAYAQNPQLAEAAEWLTSRGHDLTPRAGEERQPGSDARDPFAEAIRDGRVQIGMTGAQVRATLGAPPSTVVRMASAGRVSEVWVFAEHGISVQLTRRPHESEPAVTRITNTPRSR
jgi:hypothetical protein